MRDVVVQKDTGGAKTGETVGAVARGTTIVLCRFELLILIPQNDTTACAAGAVLFLLLYGGLCLGFSTGD